MIVSRLKIISFALLSALILSLFIGISINTIGYAANARDFKAGRIIDDTTFTNKSAMSVSAIQTFLNAKVPQCDTYGAQPSEFGGGTRRQWAEARGLTPPYTCLRDYSENNKSAAQIIYDVSQEFDINPQVFIVLLQKEQALVTDTWPTSGQYKTATGYGCPDTAACDTQYYGFTNQLRWSGRMFKAIMNASSTWYTPYILGNNYIRYNPVQSCNGSTVYIENRATQALYNYTPYQPNEGALNAGYGTAPCGAYGNRNFFLYFSDWFGPPIGNTSVVKSTDDNAFYLIDGGEKHKIPSMAVYYSYGLEKYGVANVSSVYLNSLTNGNNLGDLVRDSLGAVQLVTNGKRYRIPSGERCTDWNLDCYNPYAVTDLHDIAINLIPYGGDLQPLMASSGGIYKMKSGKREPYLSQKALFEDGYNFGTVTPVEDRLATQPYGVLLAHSKAVLKFQSDPSAIYIYLNKKYYKFESYNALVAWGFEGSVSPAPISQYTTTPPTAEGAVSDFIGLNGKKYVINNGQIIDLGMWSNDWPTPTPSPYLEELFTTYRQRTISSTSSFKAGSGGIYVAQGAKIRAFVAPDDFYSLGYIENNIINVTDAALERLPRGPKLMRQGKLFKRASSDAIFAVVGQSSLVLPSMNLFWSLRLNPDMVINIDDTTADNYASTVNISSFALVNGSQKVLGSTSVLYSSDQENLSYWGISSPSYIDISAVNNINNNSKMTRFARNSQGAIYYAESGHKHLISNYDKFIQLGGNNYNVMNVFDDFLNACPTGTTL